MVFFEGPFRVPLLLYLTFLFAANGCSPECLLMIVSYIVPFRFYLRELFEAFVPREHKGCPL